MLRFGFLTLVLALLPLGAWQSAHAQEDPSSLPSRGALLASTAASLVVLGLAALAAGWGTLGAWRWVPRAHDLPPAAAALAACGGIAAITHILQTPEEREPPVVRRIAPRDARGLLAFAGIAALAGVSEELAYRAVTVALLTPTVGLLAAVGASAVACALAHAVQGPKAMVAVLGLALVFHALVETTRCLPVAMAVHALYDLLVGVTLLAPRWAARPDNG